MNYYKNRVKKLNDKKILTHKKYVLYWMESAQRVLYNQALMRAIDMSHTLKKPLIIYFAVTDEYPRATRRHYFFMLQGLLEVKNKLNELKIPFVIEKNHPHSGLKNLSKNACAIIVDRGYLTYQKNWRMQVAQQSPCQLLEVETEVIVPVETASSKEEYAAYTLRKKINSKITEYIQPIKKPVYKEKTLDITTPYELPFQTKKDLPKIINSLSIDQTVKRSRYFIGGHSEAKKLLDIFIEKKLQHYSTLSNDPTVDMTSNLSPYLHFGQISAIEIAQKINSCSDEAKEDFLEQLIIRRELAINFVYYNDGYDKKLQHILPEWALKTLGEHQSDPREYEYSRSIFEAAKTHDDYWNAAQKELVLTGKMHNYMRMYWGKKVLEWSTTYEEAFQTLVYLNDKYALDGRDANGYAGIAWCFGKHDRAWKERKIFGKIRYMNANGLKRKFNISKYVEKVNAL